MPLPPPRTRVLRYLVASPEHAARLFPEGSALRDRALDALAREGGSAVVVESFGGSATVATMPLANGHEVATALGGLPGAVVFALRNLPAVEVAEQVDALPPSQDPSLAAVEVAARALLAALPQCERCRKRAATCAQSPAGLLCCDACAQVGNGRCIAGPYAEQVRALEAALAPVNVEAAS